MNEYALVASVVVGSVEETLVRIARAVSSDERVVGHVVDRAGGREVLVVVVTQTNIFLFETLREQLPRPFPNILFSIFKIQTFNKTCCYYIFEFIISL